MRKIEYLTAQEAEDNEPMEDISALTEAIEDQAESLNQIIDNSVRIADAMEHWAMAAVLSTVPPDRKVDYEFNHEVSCPICLVSFSK